MRVFGVCHPWAQTSEGKEALAKATLAAGGYAKPVKDFERAPHGSPVWGSLSGPDLLDAHEQYNRERMIALEETKILRCGGALACNACVLLGVYV